MDRLRCEQGWVDSKDQRSGWVRLNAGTCGKDHAGKGLPLIRQVIRSRGQAGQGRHVTLIDQDCYRRRCSLGTVWHGLGLLP